MNCKSESKPHVRDELKSQVRGTREKAGGELKLSHRQVCNESKTIFLQAKEDELIISPRLVDGDSNAIRKQTISRKCHTTIFFVKPKFAILGINLLYESKYKHILTFINVSRGTPASTDINNLLVAV